MRCNFVGGICRIADQQISVPNIHSRLQTLHYFLRATALVETLSIIHILVANMWVLSVGLLLNMWVD
jgi:hypothetical protein